MKKYISKLICAVLSLGLTLFTATQAKADVIDWFDSNGISYEIATDYAGAMVTSVYGTHSSEITIPERVTNPHTGSSYTVTRIGWAAFGSDIDWDVDFIFIPKTIVFFDEFFMSYGVNVKALNVDPENPNYASTDGVLMNKDKSLLIRYPRIKPGSTYEIPATVTKLGELCFVWCDLLTEIYIPDSVTSVGMSAFGGCVNLTKVRLSASLEKIPGQTFFRCMGLKEVIVPEGIKGIEPDAFVSCEELKKLELPASIETLDEGSLADCYLEGVYFHGNAPVAENVFGEGEYMTQATVYYRKGTTGWGPTFCGRPTAVWGDEPQPTAEISCEYKDGSLILTFTGNLQESTDTKTWKTLDAASPYTVKPDGTQKFYRTMTGGSDDQNFTIPLSNTVSLDMIWIKPGTFLMGSPEGELGRNNEIQHEVTLTKEYWIGKYEVTQAQYETIMASNPSMFKGDDMPVDNISWDHAMSFCKALTEIEKTAGRLPEGYEYTLPTEAQWEYACRAGTTTALNSGKNLSSAGACPEMDEVGWYAGNSEGVFQSVGQKKANAWGLYDMHGNVQEWCLDWYEEDYPTSAVTDPQGPNSGSERIYRGGDWSQWAYSCRSANRGHAAQNHSVNGYVGFRVALAPVK
ncbi:MAG: SUMF1/EgtB/PvdO family nonheme iron enzyme [Verrucomicrobia bacterium]|nr:SUMF1/EgtB/PvdO family nonheme iron enzyme [Verrucomicrobiota bacterium]